MSKKWLRLIALALVGALAFAACSNDSEDDAEQAQQEEDAPSFVTEEEGTVVPIQYNVWDDTDSTKLQGAPVIIAPGQEPWEANMKPGADAEVLGDVLVGEDLVFTIYPDGRDGQEIEVTIPIDANQVPKTDEPLDVIVYIEDDVVIVESGFIGFSEEFPREAA